MSVNSRLSSAAVVLGAVFVLSACGSGASSGGPSAAAGAGSSSAAASPTTSTDTVTSAAQSSSTSATSPAKTSATTASASGAHGTDKDANSDSYAFAHHCALSQLTVTVTPMADVPSRRVIAVRNNGAKSCGLSYYPQVTLDDSHASGGTVVKPMVPGGLGGPPDFPVYAGHTEYAVIDLDPSGATAGAVAGIDEINVLVDGDVMPDADTRNYPLGAGAHVLKPKLGLYEHSVADAVSSMLGANTQL